MKLAEAFAASARQSAEEQQNQANFFSFFLGQALLGHSREIFLARREFEKLGAEGLGRLVSLISAREKNVEGLPKSGRGPEVAGAWNEKMPLAGLAGGARIQQPGLDLASSGRQVELLAGKASGEIFSAFPDSKEKREVAGERLQEYFDAGILKPETFATCLLLVEEEVGAGGVGKDDMLSGKPGRFVALAQGIREGKIVPASEKEMLLHYFERNPQELEWVLGGYFGEGIGSGRMQVEIRRKIAEVGEEKLVEGIYGRLKKKNAGRRKFLEDFCIWRDLRNGRTYFCKKHMDLGILGKLAGMLKK